MDIHGLINDQETAWVNLWQRAHKDLQVKTNCSGVIIDCKQEWTGQAGSFGGKQSWLQKCLAQIKRSILFTAAVLVASTFPDNPYLYRVYVILLSWTLTLTCSVRPVGSNIRLLGCLVFLRFIGVYFVNTLVWNLSYIKKTCNTPKEPNARGHFHFYSYNCLEWTN